ncbi:conserved hypothetical protein [Microcystis aeruginosa PCC 9807]|uniref:Uncharacterized protein n=3 Tax=Microcystis TaxID=1125 RepID=I4HEH4_MICAE|nr:conserved hypothetical protein [Microcystis aeruginosa PCC 9807]
MLNVTKNKKSKMLLKRSGEKKMKKLKYRIVLQWSDEDNCYLVGLPDFPGQKWRTHGNTYAEAVKNAEEVLESLIQLYQKLGESLPHPEITKKGEILTKIN